MIWMWILLVALVTLGAIFLFGKLPAAARPLRPPFWWGGP